MRIDLTNIEKIADGKKILDIKFLTLESGKIYAVVGPNGAGKTTMLRIIAGCDRNYSGTVSYNQVKERSSDIAYMPQITYMFDLTVLENVLLGLCGKLTGFRGRSGRDGKYLGIENRAKQALLNVGMDEFINVRARTLSGGETQRVALARILVLEKNLVLLDEPASSTDLTGTELVEKYIMSVNQKNGSTVVFSTHNPSQAAHIADEVIMMYNGKVLETGSPHDVFDNPRCRETRDFLRNWRI